MAVKPSAKGFASYFPILKWGKTYRRGTFLNDGLAAIIVTIMLIPQSLAYALLAGLPPQMGLYASILPLVAYAIFGTSRTLAVGPVAVISLMTAAAAGKLAAQGSAEYIAIAGRRIYCRFFEPSCYIRLYHGLWDSDCGQPA